MLMVPICFLFIIRAYNQLRSVMKRRPPALAFLFVLLSVLIFLCFSSYYSLSNDKQFINPFAIITCRTLCIPMHLLSLPKQLTFMTYLLIG